MDFVERIAFLDIEEPALPFDTVKWRIEFDRLLEAGEWGQFTFR